MSAEIHRVIENSLLFSGLDPGLIHMIAATSSRKSFGAHQYLFQKGDPADALWGVLSGRIAIQVSTNDGKEMVLDTFEAGDVFGEVGVLDFGPRRVDAIAEESSVLFRLERQYFLQHLHSSPELCFRVFSLLCSDLRDTTEALEDTALYTLPGRLARRLVHLAGEEARDDPQDHPLLSFSQFELARMLGVHRQTVNRQLRDWEKRGWLSLRRERIELLDIDALMGVAPPGRSESARHEGWNLESQLSWPTSGPATAETIEPGQPERRMADILAVDAADYSRSLMSDAAGTLERLSKGLRAIDKAVLDGGGRTVSHTGDRVLAEFPDAGQAVQAALAIQDRIRQAGRSGEEQEPSMFRIGVHHGEVLTGKGEYLGEAVNVAIQLTRLASPGGVCFSGQALNKLESPETLEIQFLGNHDLSKVARTIPVYSAHYVPLLRRVGLRVQSIIPPRLRIASAVGLAVIGGLVIWLAAQRFATETSPAAVPARSIAVLPFEISGDSIQSYLADGLTEEIRNSLGVVENLNVTGATSSNYFKEGDATAGEIGDALRVAWLLQGSVGWAEEGLTVAVRLTDTSTEETLWTHDFQGGWQDIGQLKSTIASSLDLYVLDGGTLAQDTVVIPLSTDNEEAYELYARARQYLRQGRCENALKAEPLLEQAVELDPGFGEAWARLSGSYKFSCKEDDHPGPSRKQRADAALDRALEYAPNSPLTLAELSLKKLVAGDYDSAHRLVARALDANPNSSEALQSLSWINQMEGDWIAMQRIGERMLQLDPLSFSNVMFYIDGRLRAGDWNEVLAAAEKAHVFFPDSKSPYMYMAHGLWHLGDRLSALEMQQLGRPSGAPFDIWVGLNNDQDYLASDSWRALGALAYLGLFEQLRERLIQEHEEMDEDFPGGWLLELGELEALAGNFEASIAHNEQALALIPAFSENRIPPRTRLTPTRQSLPGLAMLYAYRQAGQEHKSGDIALWVEQFIDQQRQLYLSVGAQAEKIFLYAEAQLHAIEGRPQQALNILRTWQTISPDIFTYVRKDPFLGSLHDEPEFWAIVADVEEELAEVRLQFLARQAELGAETE